MTEEYYLENNLGRMDRIMVVSRNNNTDPSDLKLRGLQNKEVKEFKNI